MSSQIVRRHLFWTVDHHGAFPHVCKKIISVCSGLKGYSCTCTVFLCAGARYVCVQSLQIVCSFGRSPSPWEMPQRCGEMLHEKGQSVHTCAAPNMVRICNSLPSACMSVDMPKSPSILDPSIDFNTKTIGQSIASSSQHTRLCKQSKRHLKSIPRTDCRNQKCPD